MTIDDCKQPKQFCFNQKCYDNWYVCTNNTCEKCQSTSQCGAGKICLLGEENQEGVCVVGECNRSSQCSNGLVCDEVNFKCVPCKTDNDCTFQRGYTCQSGKCAPAKCSGPTDCEIYDRACVKGVCGECSGDADCGPTRRCSGRGCYRIFCGTTATTCQTYGLACVNRYCDYCQTASQCGTGYTCVNKRCQPASCRGTNNNNNSSLCYGQQICVRGICRACANDKECTTGTCLDCSSKPGCSKLCGTSCPDYCR
ncbi:MAG: hypothetical protein EP343_08130 [Deltaproteobacteria bacterium]|nr:MAG: hypothetical protein EP343_08130 [Deltaproteobacteria bacterium]